MFVYNKQFIIQYAQYEHKIKRLIMFYFLFKICIISYV